MTSAGFEKLTAKQERYCKARAAGQTPLEAMRFAGYSLNDKLSEAKLIAKANAFDRQPWLQHRVADIQGKENMQKVAQKMGAILTAIDEFDPQNVTMPAINTCTMATFRAALNVDNFGSALNALKFLAQTNGLIEGEYKEKGKAGRKPKEVPAPEDTGGNYEFDNDGREAESAEGDKIFDVFGGGAGEVPAAQDARRLPVTPHNRKRDPLPEAEPEVDGDDGWYSESDDGDAGPPGDDGGEVS